MLDIVLYILFFVLIINYFFSVSLKSWPFVLCKVDVDAFVGSIGMV